MITVHPQYITDSKGKRQSVVLSVEEFKIIAAALEDLENKRMYDDTSDKEDDERISLSEILKTLEGSR